MRKYSLILFRDHLTATHSMRDIISKLVHLALIILYEFLLTSIKKHFVGKAYGLSIGFVVG